MRIIRKGGRFYTKTAHRVAELCYERLNSKTVSVYHTFTPEEDRGRGVAEELTKAAFEFAKKNGLKIRPDCPYIPHFLERHKEWRAYTI